MRVRRENRPTRISGDKPDDHKADWCRGAVCDFCGRCETCDRVVQNPPHVKVCACLGEVQHYACRSCHSNTDGGGS